MFVLRYTASVVVAEEETFAVLVVLVRAFKVSKIFAALLNKIVAFAALLPVRSFKRV